MYNVCLRMMKKREDAEDALQDAFVDVFRKLHTFRFESTLGAWIKRIVVNNCLNLLKKQKDFIVQLENIPEISVDDNKREEDLDVQSFTVQRIKEAIQFLPSGYRVICSLYLFEGYDHQEIATFLGISESTSKSQLHRAKRKIKNSLLSHG
ncbi:MAG TPA: sigma-70 family RNA polymerase sigma factor [Saprospiraceae bacterium]|nr:sigma-70 family RNA polymerase sigma factor [Saprospiraceae bacterium]